jgi:hypothetical protein
MSRPRFKTYRDDEGARRCYECSAYAAESAESCRRCTRKAERELEAEAAAQRREIAFQAREGSDWREGHLRRYVARVLELHGAERLEFFEAHPVAKIFQS